MSRLNFFSVVLGVIISFISGVIWLVSGSDVWLIIIVIGVVLMLIGGNRFVQFDILRRKKK